MRKVSVMPWTTGCSCSTEELCKTRPVSRHISRQQTMGMQSIMCKQVCRGLLMGEELSCHLLIAASVL